ncbi:SUMF1/EgtB/PvdO family nonheme iron enzyme, partial [bacterium]|nr:SUMF1/EgtB/PvdO family nonheme iron enzyme [candidate division CSSED10-310 bacterium]
VHALQAAARKRGRGPLLAATVILIFVVAGLFGLAWMNMKPAGDRPLLQAIKARLGRRFSAVVTPAAPAILPVETPANGDVPATRDVAVNSDVAAEATVQALFDAVTTPSPVSGLDTPPIPDETVTAPGSMLSESSFPEPSRTEPPVESPWAEPTAEPSRPESPRVESTAEPSRAESPRASDGSGPDPTLPGSRSEVAGMPVQVPGEERVPIATATAVYKDPFAAQVMTIPGLGMEFIRVRAGSFLMGSDHEGSYEQPSHYVRIGADFWIARREVTLAEYRQFMKETGKTDGMNWGDRSCPFRYMDGYPLTGFQFGQVDTQPVVKVSWFGAMDWCGWLTQREAAAGRLPSGYGVRLPTEAEWEYACRAGSSGRYHWGDTWDCTRAMAENDTHSAEKRCAGEYRNRRLPVNATAPVGSFAPNMWGIFDMNGNVWEWCLDWFDPRFYARSSTQDPKGPPDGDRRVIRGGSWLSPSGECSASFRGSSDPGAHHSAIGFRPVMAVTL